MDSPDQEHIQYNAIQGESRKENFDLMSKEVSWEMHDLKQLYGRFEPIKHIYLLTYTYKVQNLEMPLHSMDQVLFSSFLVINESCILL